MYAQIVVADFTDVEVAIKGLDQLVPSVKAAPGFVAGYWAKIDDAHGTSMAVFDTEEHARAAAPPAGAGMEGVTIRTVEIGEVMGSATA
jgi:hypothetical protein